MKVKYCGFFCVILYGLMETRTMYWFLVLTLISSVKTCSCLYSSVNTDATFCGKVPVKCQDEKYRAIDGSCNNLEHPWWGTPLVPYKRLSCGALITLDDKNLPNARDVSYQSFADIYEKDNLWTLLFMQYGQEIAHEVSLTYGIEQTEKQATVCCAKGKLTEAARIDPRCSPISVSNYDSVYAPENITCIDFYRVTTTADTKCTNATKIPQPLNAVTSSLDLSFVYGSNITIATKLRAFKYGLLNLLKRKGLEVLPQDSTPQQTCRVDCATEPCYMAGDVRVNQNPQLAVLQTVMARHHNYIAGELARVNPHWDDETLYQESRRIMIAWHQRIVYYEYLDGVLGTQFLIDNNMTFPNATGYINDYDKNINLAAYNEYAVSAFRVFHDEIQGLIRSVKEDRNTSNIIMLSDWFDKPSICEQGRNFIGLTTGLATQPSRARKRYITKDVHYELFKDGLLGQDLKAIDIQRARDQGVCSYANTLRAMGVANPRSFDDFNKFMNPGNTRILKNIYKHFERVELAPAMFLESRQSRALSSPLGQAIMKLQFLNLRRGDRYFFENSASKGAFTLDQLNEIRRVGTITNIFCASGGVKQMQPNAFKIISDTNPLQDCNLYPKFNPDPWKE